jgi:hypothetical protein
LKFLLSLAQNRLDVIGTINSLDRRQAPWALCQERFL